MSPKSKGNKNDESKYHFSTPNRYDVLSEANENDNDNSQKHTDIVS